MSRIPNSPLAAPYRSSVDLSGDEPRTGHRTGPVVATCEAVLGRPDCYAVIADRDCTELLDVRTLKPVTDEQHRACELAGAAAFMERLGAPCDDCAFRPGSPEMRDGLTGVIAEQSFNGRPVPFNCHQGMPIRFLGTDEDGQQRVCYEPRDPLATTYPICNGWAYYQALEAAEVLPDEVRT